MSAFTNLTGLAGIALALATMTLSLPGMARLPQRSRLGLVCGVALAVLISFGGLPLAAYVRALTGDLSITTQLLLALALQRRLNGGAASSPCGVVAACGNERNHHALLGFIFIAALLLYPMALGYGMLDPYRLGYGNLQFLVALLAVALLAWWRQLPALTLAITLAVLAWALGWMESTNLWDTLLDPWLAMYATGALLRSGVRVLRG
jgi:hypothetical protein